MKILITGGDGRFCSELKKYFFGKNIFYKNKKDFDIKNFNKIFKLLKKLKINILIHTAALSRPMILHEKFIEKSIDTNIIGTCNLVKACKKLKIKIIYFSTSYVYPCRKGNYKESDFLYPINNYAWSKLGGEAAVHMYKNSLILRIAMTEYPFLHKAAFNNAKCNFLYHFQFAKILPKILKYKGILNIGGKSMNIYKFAKKTNPNVRPIYINKKIKFPKDSSMNVLKLTKILGKHPSKIN